MDRTDAPADPRSAQTPLTYDPSPFGQWLRAQKGRRDPVGHLARVALQDWTWPGGYSRSALAAYFKQMGARRFVQQTLAQAWDEFAKAQKRERNKAKRREQKQARKKNRKPR